MLRVLVAHNLFLTCVTPVRAACGFNRLRQSPRCAAAAAKDSSETDAQPFHCGCREVLDALRKSQLFVNPANGAIFQKHVTFLGLVISPRAWGWDMMRLVQYAPGPHLSSLSFEDNWVWLFLPAALPFIQQNCCAAYGHATRIGCLNGHKKARKLSRHQMLTLSSAALLIDPDSGL